jgi:hypothetical protein
VSVCFLGGVGGDLSLVLDGAEVCIATSCCFNQHPAVPAKEQLRVTTGIEGPLSVP